MTKRFQVISFFKFHLKAQNLNSRCWLLHISFSASCGNLDYYIERVSLVDELFYSHHIFWSRKEKLDPDQVKPNRHRNNAEEAWQKTWTFKLRKFNVFLKTFCIIIAFIDMNTHALCWKLKLPRQFSLANSVNQVCFFFFFQDSRLWEWWKQCSMVLETIGKQCTEYMKETTTTLRGIIDDGAK